MRKDETGKCPNCLVSVRFESITLSANNGSPLGQVDPITIHTKTTWRARLEFSGCPACGKPIVALSSLMDPQGVVKAGPQMLWPETGERPTPAEVEAEDPTLAEDFREAVVVLPKSKKASAALSRRCLQFLLTRKAGTKKRDLADQIDEVLPSLPTQLAANVDVIRQIGNFAAHPTKSKSSNEIIDVEDGEAEWSLDVLEQLFDHYYVAPARAAAKRAALNAKLAAMAKPPLKTP